MLDLFNRSNVPAYRGAQPSAQRRTGLLASLGCYLFGGGVPGYRGTAAQGGATAPAVSRCWWSLTGSPQYRTPPAPPVSPPGEPVLEPVPEVPSNGETQGEGVPCGSGPEIHIYTAG